MKNLVNWGEYSAPSVGILGWQGQALCRGRQEIDTGQAEGLDRSPGWAKRLWLDATWYKVKTQSEWMHLWKSKSFSCLITFWLFVTPMDSSWPGSSVCGITQARILEWVAVPFSRGFSQLGSLALQADSLPSEPPGKPLQWSCLENSMDRAMHLSHVGVSCLEVATVLPTCLVPTCHSASGWHRKRRKLRRERYLEWEAENTETTEEITLKHLFPFLLLLLKS